MTKAKLHLLAVLVVAAGLLLGGNVNADTTTVTTTSTTSNDAVQAQIQSIREKIQALTAEIQSKQQQPVEPVVRQGLTQAQLDTIEVAVNRIATETERIKAQVQILVRIRTIEAKIAAIKAQIGAPAAGQVVATTPVSELSETQKEARIAQIQQQIGELNQEMQSKRAAETATSSVAENTCTGPSCSAASSSAEQPVAIQTTPSTEKTAEAAKPGFWQSIGDFVRKIFTF